MKTLTIKIPKELETEENNLLLLFASFLYEKGKLSLGQAAEFAGLSKKSFMEILGNYNVSVFNTPVSDLKRDAANA